MTLDPRLRALDRVALPGALTLLVADTRLARARGLAGLDELAAGHALVLKPCRCVHTVGMRFALDLLWLDGGGELVRLDAAVRARRVRGCLRARAVIECGAGEGERFAAALAAAGGAWRADAAPDTMTR